MSSKVIELTRYERRPGGEDGEVVWLEWEIDGIAYERQVTYAKIDTREKLMEWLNYQLALAPEPAPVLTGRYILTIDDATGLITDISRDTQVDDILALIPQRQAAITADLAALPAATTAEVKAIIGRQLQSENKILSTLAGILRFLKRIA